MEIIKREYSGYEIYFYDAEYEALGKAVLEKQYQEISRLKDTLRNLVMIITWKGKRYVLKEPRNEYRIVQRKLMTFWKRGEALNTLMQVHTLREKLGRKEYVESYVAIVKRRRGMIVFSALITEFSEGREAVRKDLDLVVETVKEIHDLGYYHGDCNPSNFLIEAREGKDYVRILDTQAKKMGFSNIEPIMIC